MKKVSIITRAYNRLEYTIKCIDSVKKNTNYDNYEHIIINNNSSDGTKEWLDWIVNSKIKYFNKIKPIHMNSNLGDWGGMLEAHKYVSDDSEYYVQLDNDVEILDSDWLNKMIFILENTKHNIVQLKRMGVKNVVNARNIKTLKYEKEDLKFGTINRPVACFMLRTSDFTRLYNKLLNTGFYEGKTKLSQILGGTVKLTNVSCQIMDGLKKNVLPMNYVKYPSKLKINNVNVIQEMK